MDEPSIGRSSRSQPQKRILPSRSRRGGPGVGTCDADLMILEAKRRQLESEPLIPAATKITLTTNFAAASTSSGTGAMKLNVVANERYFDRPEVLKAYREQLVIETPEFISLGDIPNAGRLRARSQAGITEDGPSETSDVAYEKRHRKYETFEKRQRLREKEKLKHEQYKLKERIEQLRSMDGSAFLALPASLFSAPETDSNGGIDGTQQDENVLLLDNEGEKRRKEMLDIAYALEERYRVLLPPERGKKGFGVAPLDSSVEPPPPIYSGRSRHDAGPGEESSPEFIPSEPDKVKVKLKVNGRTSLSTPVMKLTHVKKGRKGVPYKNTHGGRRRKAFSEEGDAQQEVVHPEEALELDEMIQVEEPSQSDDNLVPEDAEESEAMSMDQSAQTTDSIRPDTPPILPEEGTLIDQPELHDLADCEPEGINDLGKAEHGAVVAVILPAKTPPPESEEAELEASSAYQIRGPSLPPSPTDAIIQTVLSPTLQQKSNRRGSTPMSRPEIAVLDTSYLDSTYDDDEETPYIAVSERSARRRSQSHPAKRLKVTAEVPSSPGASRDECFSISVPLRVPRPPKQSVVYINAAGIKERTCSALLIAAIRSSGNSSRKGKRNVSAFGVKIANDVFDVFRDYALPDWVHCVDVQEQIDEGKDVIPGVRMISRSDLLDT